MYCLGINKKNAESLKKRIIELNIGDQKYMPISNNEKVFFPIKSKDIPQDLLPHLINREQAETICQKKFKKRKNLKFKDLLKQINGLNPDEVIKSYDLLGNLAIIEIKPEHIKFEKQIAQKLIQSHPTIKTVVKKIGATSGVFRIRPVKVLAGVETTIAHYKENNCTFLIDVNKMYFSPRLSFERERLAKKVKPNENVIVLFAGTGPFAIVISKHSKANKIISIELNPDAYSYMLKNIELNKCKNIEPYLMDARNTYKKFPNWADRIIMPLPKGAEHFLDSALLCLKDHGYIHLYSFCEEEQINTWLNETIHKKAVEQGFKSKILSKRIVRPFAPGIVQICIDIEFSKTENKTNSKNK